MIGTPLTEKVRVKIYGKEYEIDTGGLTPLEVNRIASYVDEKMHEIAEKLCIVDTQKIAVLAALNIALELNQQQENVQASKESKKIKDLIKTLDDALK